MKVVFDISVLGVGFAKPSARAGIFRFTESILEALALRGDLEIVLVAEKNLVDCWDYLRGNAPRAIASLPFAVDPVRTGLLAWERRFDRKWQLPLRKACDAARVLWCMATRNIDLRGSGAWDGADIYLTPHFMHWPHRFPRTFRGRPFLIHYDLIPLLHPEWFAGPETSALRAALDGPIRDWWSISISESTKNDLVRHVGLDPSKIFTVPLAADSLRFHTSVPADARAAMRERLGFGQAPFILALNTLEPRKNLEGAIQAFAMLARRPEFQDLRLVLAGAKGWKMESLLRSVEDTASLSDRIVFSGYVPDEDLAPLYSEAEAFVYLSWYEGFGLPPLEAMACGTPVVCSNTSSLPEVVGDAGILVPPDAPEVAASALESILRDSARRAILSRKGVERAAAFSWTRAASGIVDAWKVSTTCR